MDIFITAGRPSLVAGGRTGKFRLGRDQLLVKPNGESKISFEDELFSNVVDYRVSQAAFSLEPFLSTLRWALARS